MIALQSMQSWASTPPLGCSPRPAVPSSATRGGVLAMFESSMRWPLAAAMLWVACSASAQPAAPADNKPDATLRSTPETVVWGYFAADIPPALRIKSGQAVRVDTVSHGGVN